MSDLFHYHKWLRLIWTNLQQSVCQSWMIFQDSISKFYIITGKAQLVKRNLTKSVLQWVTRGQQAAYRRVTNSWSTVAGMVMFDVATPVWCQMHHYHLQYHQLLLQLFQTTNREIFIILNAATLALVSSLPLCSWCDMWTLAGHRLWW